MSRSSQCLWLDPTAPPADAPEAVYHAIAATHDATCVWLVDARPENVEAIDWIARVLAAQSASGDTADVGWVAAPQRASDLISRNVIERLNPPSAVAACDARTEREWRSLLTADSSTLGPVHLIIVANVQLDAEKIKARGSQWDMTVTGADGLGDSMAEQGGTEEEAIGSMPQQPDTLVAALAGAAAATVSSSSSSVSASSVLLPSDVDLLRLFHCFRSCVSALGRPHRPGAECTYSPQARYHVLWEDQHGCGSNFYLIDARADNTPAIKLIAAELRDDGGALRCCDTDTRSSWLTKQPNGDANVFQAEAVDERMARARIAAHWPPDSDIPPVGLVFVRGHIDAGALDSALRRLPGSGSDLTAFMETSSEWIIPNTEEWSSGIANTAAGQNKPAQVSASAASASATSSFSSSSVFERGSDAAVATASEANVDIVSSSSSRTLAPTAKVHPSVLQCLDAAGVDASHPENWSNVERTRATAALFAPWLAAPDRERRSNWPPYLLLCGGAHTAHLPLLAHLQLDFPLPLEDTQCVFDALAMAAPRLQPAVPARAPVSVMYAAALRERNRVQEAIAQNVRTHGYDFGRVYAALVAAAATGAFASRAGQHPSEPWLERALFGHSLLGHWQWTPELVSQPSLPLAKLEECCLLDRALAAEHFDVVKALLRRGYNPNIATSTSNVSPTGTAIPIYNIHASGTRSSLPCPLVGSMPVRLLGPFLRELLECGVLHTLNLRSRNIAHLDFQQSAVEAARNTAYKQPFSTLSQLRYIALYIVDGWQAANQAVWREQEEKEVAAASDGVGGGATCALTSSSSSSAPSVSGSSFSSSAATPASAASQSDNGQGCLVHLSGLYLADRLKEQLHLHSVPLLCTAAELDAWLVHFTAVAAQEQSQWQLPYNSPPAELGAFAARVYLGQRDVLPLEYPSSAQQLDPQPMFSLIAALAPVLERRQAGSKRLALASFEPHAETIVGQLERLSHCELFGYRGGSGRASAIKSIVGSRAVMPLLDVRLEQFPSPLMSLPVPTKRGDAVWRMWDVILRRHLESEHIHPHYDLKLAQQCCTRASCVQNGAVNSPPLCFLFDAIASCDPVGGACLDVWLGLVQLLAAHGFDRCNGRNSFGWHLVMHISHQESWLGAECAPLLCHYVEHNLMQMEEVSPTTQRTLREDAAKQLAAIHERVQELAKCRPRDPDTRKAQANCVLVHKLLQRMAGNHD